MADDPRLPEIARNLYGLEPSGFTAARNDEVRNLRQVGATALASRVAVLRKPTAGAALVNRLVRDHADLVVEIRDLGVELRAAQLDAEPGELRALDHERRALVRRCVDAAGASVKQGGGRATDASLRDVEQTVWAALVDAGAFAALKAGVLVQPMAPHGFGTVDTSEASALPVVIDTGDVPDPRSSRRRRAPLPDAGTPSAAKQREHDHAIRAARQAVEDAAAQLDKADRHDEQVSRDVDGLQQRLDAFEVERTALRERLSAVDREVAETRSDFTARTAARRDAERTRRTAAADLDRARRLLDQLEPGTDGRADP